MDSFVGEIRVFGFNWAPESWAMCNGQIASIAQYTALFAIIGTRYGGDGKTTFGLPNMQGYAPIGAGSGPGLTPRGIKPPVGEETVLLRDTQIPSHDHTMTMKLTSSAYTSMTAAPTASQSWLSRVVRPTSATAGTSVLEFAPPPAGNMTPLNDMALSAAGGGQGHENRQPYLSMNFCISLAGIFPVQA